MSPRRFPAGNRVFTGGNKSATIPPAPVSVPARRQAVQFDRPAPVLGAHNALRGTQPNASASGPPTRRVGDLAEFDVAAPVEP